MTSPSPARFRLHNGHLLAAALLAAGFGRVAWLLAMGGLTCGLLYDLWLKRTPASALPYVVGLPLLPLWVWVATSRFCSAFYAVIPLGLLLGLALLWRYRDGRSIREMADFTGKTEKAMERLLARAREHFRRRWNDAQP